LVAEVGAYQPVVGVYLWVLVEEYQWVLVARYQWVVVPVRW
jgi:hypothetical protein